MNHATIAIAATLLVLGVAACTSSNSPGVAGGGPHSASGSVPGGVLAYSRCMRSHGVPDFPDPDRRGNLPKGDAHTFGVSSAQLQTAQRACQHVLPSTGGPFEQQTQQCIAADDCPQALVQQILTVQRRYSRCMRSRGFPNWPDPTVDSQGRPFFDVSKAGMSEAETRSAKWTSSDRVCERLAGVDGDVPVDLG
jgi:hypothetical protein